MLSESFIDLQTTGHRNWHQKDDPEQIWARMSKRTNNHRTEYGCSGDQSFILWGHHCTLFQTVAPFLSVFTSAIKAIKSVFSTWGQQKQVVNTALTYYHFPASCQYATHLSDTEQQLILFPQYYCLLLTQFCSWWWGNFLYSWMHCDSLLKWLCLDAEESITGNLM